MGNRLLPEGPIMTLGVVNLSCLLLFFLLLLLLFYVVLFVVGIARGWSYAYYFLSCIK